jgi:hypothetical protein
MKAVLALATSAMAADLAKSAAVAVVERWMLAGV